MKTEEKTIGGFKYRMEQVGMDAGEQIVLRLSRPLTALFASAVAAGGADVSLEQLVATGAEPFIRNLSGKDLRYVRKKLAAKTTVWIPDGKIVRDWPLSEVYDTHFAGRYLEAMQWLKWGLQMNRFFGDALDRLDEMLAARAKGVAAKKAGSKSHPAAETAGGSGDSSSPRAATPLG